MERKCEICGSNDKKLLYHQTFILPTKYYFHGGYDVAMCKYCGFVFADNIPQTEFFENYYKEMSKKSFYLSKNIYRKDDKNSVYDKDMNKRIIHSIGIMEKFISKNDRILDIGCYTGELLYILKKRGYKNSIGIDPSPFATEIARKKYGLNVITASAYDDLNIGKFDAVLLTHVLEHIKDLRMVLTKVISYLKPEGIVYIETPDANNFFISKSSDYLPEHQESFQQFSVEHINFFTKTSTTNLMNRNGFKKVFLESQVSVIAILASVWKPGNISIDHNIEEKIKIYIKESKKLIKGVEKIIDSILKSKREIYIWGAGVHTQRMLAITNMKNLKIRAFIDINPSYHKAKLMGKPIISPEALTKKTSLPILISSKGYQEEIVRQIHSIGLTNRIIRLYE